MFIRKISFNGIKGIRNKVELDLTPKDNSKFLEENIETFGLEKTLKKEFSVLKQVGIIGLNSSGKTSVLEGIKNFIAMLVNPGMNRHLYIMTLNAFEVNKPVTFKAEIVTHVEDHSTEVARKYNILLIIKNGLIEEEKIEVTSASKTSSKDKKTIYHLEKNKLKVGDKTLTHGNQMFSIFSLIRIGQVNEIIAKATKPYLADFFNSLSFIDQSSEASLQEALFNNNFWLPTNNKISDKLNELMRLFDPKFISIKRDELGTLTLKMKDGTNEVDIKGVVNISNTLSAGTREALFNSRRMFKAFTSKGIMLADEMDKSFHTGLFKTMMQIYRENSKSQLIFTTHNSDIFTFQFRYDQLNIIKSVDGKTILKRISDLEEGINNDSSIKRIKSLIKNTPETNQRRKVVDAFKK